MLDIDQALSQAIKVFWSTRSKQKENQGSKTGQKDAGDRSAVTGGKHADAIVRLVRDVLVDSDIPDAQVFYTSKKRPRTLPGFYRPTKEWDLVAVSRGHVLAVIEVKSQVGSFGNNFNNRVEEALGNATDFWEAYEKGTFAPSTKPWLGYLFILEAHPTSVSARKTPTLPHYQIRDEFHGASYVKQYEIFMEKLVRKRLYDAACLITSSREDGPRGVYQEPNAELSFRHFAASLAARAHAFSKLIE